MEHTCACIHILYIYIHVNIYIYIKSNRYINIYIYMYITSHIYNIYTHWKNTYPLGPQGPWGPWAHGPMGPRTKFGISSLPRLVRRILAIRGRTAKAWYYKTIQNIYTRWACTTSKICPRPYCTLLYLTVPYYTLLYLAATYCTQLHLTVPNCTLLYLAAHYCTLLCLTAPYCTVPARRYGKEIGQMILGSGMEYGGDWEGGQGVW